MNFDIIELLDYIKETYHDESSDQLEYEIYSKLKDIDNRLEIIEKILDTKDTMGNDFFMND